VTIHVIHAHESWSIQLFGAQYSEEVVIWFPSISIWRLVELLSRTLITVRAIGRKLYFLELSSSIIVKLLVYYLFFVNTYVFVLITLQWLYGHFSLMVPPYSDSSEISRSTNKYKYREYRYRASEASSNTVASKYVHN